MLEPRTTRARANLVTFAASSLVFGGVFFPTVAYVTSGRSLAASFRQEPSHSWAKDVREGKTTAGQASNGFVGRLSDGREVTLVQVSSKIAGGIEAWTPDGKPIAEADWIKVPHLALSEHSRTILIRFKNLYPNPEGGLGSGPGRTGGEPSTLVFAGGDVRPSARPGEWEAWSYIGVPKEDGDRSSFTFSLNDEPWTTDVEVPATPGKKGDFGHLKAVEVAYPAVATPFTRNAKGRTVRDAAGKYLHDKIESTSVSWVGEGDDAGRMPRVTAKLKNGKTLEPIWNDGGYIGGDMHSHYYFRAKPTEIETVKVETRAYMNVEFLDVRLKPTKG